jgi:streptogramin lyase
MAIGRRWLGALFALGMGFVLAPVQAQPQVQAAVDAGTGWLQAQVQSDGGLRDEARSGAIPAQARAEALRTLALAGILPPALVQRVQAEQPAETELRARRHLALRAAGVSEAWAAGAAGGQGTDGGFAPATGYQSTALDTAFALLALAGTPEADLQAAGRALGYLASNYTADGGYGVHGQARVAVAARVLSAATAWRTRFEVGTIAQRAASWLMAQRDAQGRFASVADDALALAAFHTHGVDGAARDALIAALVSTQGADGDWNADPYDTALAVRALWALLQAPPPPAGGSITGRLIDAATGISVSGAGIRLVERAESGAASASDGRFHLHDVPAGEYTLRVEAVGYASRELALQVQAGQLLQLGNLDLQPAALSSTLSGTVRNTAGQPLADVLVGVGTLNTTTNSAGFYRLVGLNPGPATISMTRSGYRPLAVDAVLLAGTEHVFSPTLYSTSVTPPSDATLRGRLLDSDTQAAIAGATVVVGERSALSGSDGRFSIAQLPLGGFEANVAATGYAGVRLSGSLSAGVNDAGDIRLQRVPTSSILLGTVTDIDSADPVVGALVTVAGTSITAVTDAAGGYRLEGIANTSFRIMVEADGYSLARFDLLVSQHGTHRFDLQLAAQPEGEAVYFREVRTNLPEFGPYEEFELEIEIHNPGETDRELIVDAVVLDADGQVSFELRANAFGFGQNPPNLPIAVPAQSLIEVEMERILLRQPAGNYTVHARGYDTGGRLVAQGTAVFSVRAEARLAGGLVVDPPLLHAGTATPVQFTAELTNTGNRPIPAGDYRLTVTLEAADNQTSTEPRVELVRQHSGAPLRLPRGAVADEEGNVFVANAGNGQIQRIAPDGSIQVVATLPVNAVGDVALRPEGGFWVSQWDGPRLWRVEPSGDRTEFTSANLQRIRGVVLEADGSLLLAGESSLPAGIDYRLVRRAPDGAETLLWANGLAEPASLVLRADGAAIVSNRRDNTLSLVLPSGQVQPYLSGFNRPGAMALAADGSLFVSNTGDNTVLRVAPDGSREVYAAGLNQPGELALAANGDLYIVNRGDHRILRVPEAGQVETFAQGLANGPQGLLLDAQGGLLIGNDDGSLRRLAPDGQVSELAAGIGSPRGMTLAADGAVLISSYSNGTVRRVQDGAVANFATGLSTPFGVAALPSGEVMVAEYSAHRFARLDAEGSVIARTQTLVQSPQQLRIDAAGRLFSLNTGFVTVREAGITRRLVSARTYSGIAPDGSGGFLAVASRDVYRVDAAGNETRIASALPFTIYDIAIDALGRTLLLDYSGRRVHELLADGQAVIIASMTEYPQEMVATLDGRIFLRTTSSRIWRLMPDDSLAQLGSFSAHYQIGTGVDGSLIAHAYDSTNRYHVRRVDPETGSGTPLQRTDPTITSTLVTGVALLGDGSIVAASSNQQRLVDFRDGSVAAELAGFINPTDLLWDGTRLLFVDSSYLYAWDPDGYPQRLGAFAATWLSLRGGEIVGSRNGSLLRWTGSGSQSIANPIAGGSTLNGVAGTADGRLFVAFNGDSRIVELGANNAIVNDYAGIVSPVGLAFDPEGGLHVASSGPRTIVRLAQAGEAARFVARNLSNLRHIRFAADGTLWATRANLLSRIDRATGAFTDVANVSGASFWGLDARDGRLLVADSNLNQIRQWSGSALQVLAAGLHNVTSLRLDANGAPLMVSASNGTLNRFVDGSLQVKASGLGTPIALALDASGRALVAGGSGAAFLVSPEGEVRDARVDNLVGNVQLTGAAARADDFLLFDQASSTGTIYRLRIAQAVPPPPVGTVVHQAVRSAESLPADEELMTIDFGQWIPPYGGDFRARVERDGVDGSANNFLHVGGFATGLLTTTRPRVPPGDQLVPLRLQLTGADFAAISRVETAGFRRVVGISFPKGIAADRAGNIYFTDGSAIRRVNAAGQSEPLVTGIAPQFGLVTDSQERLYLPNRAANGRYQLLRVSLAGEVETLLDLGTASVNGIGVDSLDQILIGRQNALLRFDPEDGALATVSTVGIGTPLGLAVDGRDNVYIQNTSHHVIQVTPDGATRTIFSRRDGVIDPVFEGDGYPTITADCADNFYVTAFTWARVGQNGEERVLSQVVPRTGQVVGLLDVSRVDSRVGDIDYLAFDRFNSRLMMWDHNTSAIYQIPVTCGAIGVDAHLLTRPGQTLDSFDQQPAATVLHADGRTEYVWSLRDVAADGIAINFDTVLTGLSLGERRAAIDSGFLNFRNSFAPQDIRVPVRVPLIEVENLVGLALDTDRAEYAAQETAQIVATLDNANPLDVVGDLRIEVRDDLGQLVASVLQTDVVLPAGGSVQVEGLFPIGSTVPGPYRAHAVLVSEGREAASAETPFRVLADNAEAAVGARLQLDRAEYRSGERVGIASHVLSQSANLILQDLLLTVQVYDPSAVLRATYHETIPQLLPGATRSFANQFELLGAAAGDWRVRQVLSDGYGRSLDIREATFRVLSDSDSGDGLRGEIAATPADAQIGTPVRLDYRVENLSNADFAGLPLRLLLLDIEQELELWRWDGSADLPRDGEHTGSETWPTEDVAPGIYTAVLLAEVGGELRLLARTDVRLGTTGVAVEASQEIQREARLLVLIGCQQQGNSPPCYPPRRDFLSAYLTELGVVHRIVGSAAEFDLEFSSGRWNSYWISGEWQRLGQTLADRLVEAAFRGDGLIADGEHDSRNHLLDPVLGFRYRGKLPHADYQVAIEGSGLFADVQFIGRGKAARYELAGATAHGRFSASPSDPAVLTARFGLGRSLSFGFDLVATLMQEPESEALRDLLDAGIRHITPLLPESFVAGAFVPLTTQVRNLGSAVELDVQLDVAPPTRIETHAPAAVEHSSQHVLWRLFLDQAEDRDLDAGLRLGDGAEPVEIETRVAASGATGDPLVVLRTSIPRVALDQHLGDTLAAIRDLTPTSPSDRNARDQAAARFAAATALIDQGAWSAAIVELLKARDSLLRISTVDVAGARLGIDETLRAAAYRWYLQQIEE